MLKPRWLWLILAAGLCSAALSTCAFASSWKVQPVAAPSLHAPPPLPTDWEKLLEAPLDEWPIYVSGAMTRPVFLDGKPPIYSANPCARIHGTVVMAAVIDEQGRVTGVRVVRPLLPAIDSAAVEAVKTWRFKPATLNGKAVKVFYTLTVNYQLTR